MKNRQKKKGQRRNFSTQLDSIPVGCVPATCQQYDWVSLVVGVGVGGSGYPVHKFEHFSSDGHQMSLAGGYYIPPDWRGRASHLTEGVGIVGYPMMPVMMSHTYSTVLGNNNFALCRR